jgi:hypothetical protein
MPCTVTLCPGSTTITGAVDPAVFEGARGVDGEVDADMPVDALARGTVDVEGKPVP